MATKGASNRYGNTRGGRKGHSTNNTGFAWAKAFNKNTLQQHFKKHGTQMEAHTKESYNAKAVRFANNVDRKNCITMKDGNGTTYKYNKKTNEFAMITKKGIVITYYKPKNGIKYFKNQKGD